MGLQSLGGGAQKLNEGAAGHIGDGGIELYDNADDVRREKCNSPGADDARIFIFLSGNLVRGSVEVADVAGVECGDMHLKIFLSRPLEGRVAHEVQRREIQQGGEPFGGYPPLHHTKIAQPVLILTR